ncbi:MAG: hypothetical protein WKG00_02315 [Polyangiaceae bacterium]
MRVAPEEPPPATARQPRSASRLREVVLLAGSAAVVLLAAANATPRAPASAAAVASASAGADPSPLPSGAEARPPSAPFPEASCDIPDRGFGEYAPWRSLRIGRVLVPTHGGLDDEGGFAVLFHFHGADAVRKELAPEGLSLVVAAVDAGTLSSHYAKVVGAPVTSLTDLTTMVAAAVAEATGDRRAHASHVALSSWSAGYGAVAELLRRPHPGLEGLILLDSLHASWGAGAQEIEPTQLAPFLAEARAAAAGNSLFYLTHSEIQPEGYASTGRVAAYLLRQMGGERGGFFARGFPGDTAAAHCAHLRLLPSIVREHLLPAWR